MHVPRIRADEQVVPSVNDARNGSRAEHRVTKRNVRAILIAGDQIDCPGTPTPGALDSLNIIEQHLVSRFAPGDVKIERLGRRPSRQLVVDAFQSMAKIAKTEEMLVVMFAGHGAAAGGMQHSPSWLLTVDEAFTSVDLAMALDALPPGVDTVVLSDCCFGEGLFDVTDLGKLPSRLQPRNSPMVCISAAGRNHLVELAKLANLATQTVAAADAMHSYRQLARTFAARAVAGCTFHVDARPAHRLDDLVLSPERRRLATADRRPVEPNRRPPTRRAGPGLSDDLDRPHTTVCASAPIERAHERPPQTACQEPRRSGAFTGKRT